METIELAKIPQAEKEQLAAAAYDAVMAFFGEPGVKKAFEAWQRGKETKDEHKKRGPNRSSGGAPDQEIQ